MVWEYKIPYEQMIVRIAKRLAIQEGYEWQAFPLSSQLTKQNKYKQRARELLELIEDMI